jgi:heptaprenyl diphosphate synthase
MTHFISTTRDDHRIAGLAALAIAIHLLESALPSPLPGVKPGLANVVTLVVLLRYGWRAAAWVTILRVVAGSLLLGTFLSPAFLLSCSGACAALAALGAGERWSHWVPAWSLGPVGFSVTAAVAHMTGQFYVAYRLFVPHEGLFHLLPILLVMAMAFGAVSGGVVHAVIKNLEVSRS